jgi:CRISPR system Cascade subunit CasA
MPSYDLLTEPWIPVLDARIDLRSDPDAPMAPAHVGLRDALLRAHELGEVAGGSPLETIALYRLLLALTLDVYQPDPEPDVWADLWRAGRFPAEPLDAYLSDPERGASRFDLLHPTRPFYQHATPDASQSGKDPAPLAKLFHDQASGNNATLFGHQLDSQPSVLPLAQAARGLVATQAAALGGGVSKPFNFSDAPLVGRLQFWIRGRSLFDALLLNGPPDREARMGAQADAPVWRQPLPDPYRKREHRGLLDVLTWPSRRLTLATAQRGDQTVATGVYLTQGDKLDPQPTDDPLAAHVQGKNGRFPLGLKSDRVLWRDAAVLMQSADAEGRGAPATFAWAMAIAPLDLPEFAGELDRVFRSRGADAFGLVNDQAKAELWRHVRFPLYRSIFVDEDRRYVLQDALAAAEQQLIDKKKGLRPAMRTLGDFALAPPGPGDDAYPNSDTKAVTALSQHLGAEPRYWAALEVPFFAFLESLADAPDEDARSAALDRWRSEVFGAAVRAFDQATTALGGGPRQLRAVAKGRARLQPVASS